MVATSKIDICNMALSHLGSYGSINDIDSPETEPEIQCARWYDVTREAALRLAVPNFAATRRIVSQKSAAPAFGYSYAYEYPSDCLKVLGFGEIDEKDLNYNVENSDSAPGMEIQMDEDFTTGLKLRFIKNITDVSSFTADFQILLSWLLAEKIALPVTQKRQVRNDITEQIPAKISEFSGVSAQENPPVRKSDSKFKQSRYSNPTRNNEKR